jgi:hypothetical protein
LKKKTFKIVLTFFDLYFCVCSSGRV